MKKVSKWFKRQGDKKDWLIITGIILFLLALVVIYFIGIPLLIVAVLGAFGVQANYWVGLGIWIILGMITGGFRVSTK